MQTAICAWLTAINLLAFCLCGWDKLQARRHGRRIPEHTLLLLCALGGGPAFFAGMLLFHHKTRKPRFLYGVPAVFAAEILLLFLLRGF